MGNQVVTQHHKHLLLDQLFRLPCVCARECMWVWHVCVCSVSNIITFVKIKSEYDTQ